MSEIKKCWVRLIDSFPNSFINSNDEFIAHERSNQYICLGNCETELDIQCKVLEWFSRPAHKTAPYCQEWRNNQFHKFILSGINEFLSTKFTERDISDVYDELGNAINHNLTIKFINSGYNLSFLKEISK
jgi:hypothetical protein